MKITPLTLLAFLLAPLIAIAGDHFSPHQRAILEAKSPPPVAYRFSFDAPAGPQFSDAEKEAQRERGKLVMPMVMKAFDAGAAEVRIPPGDYRFGQERQVGAKTIFPLHFEQMQRDAAHPFVIDATGVTFWFDLDDVPMPPGHRCVGFFDCRNIVLRGAIIDRGTRGCFEGRITKIDRAGNRFEVQPAPGHVAPTVFKGHQRLIPFKSDGRFCAPLYDLQQFVHKLDYTDIKPSANGRYWIQMKAPDLIARIHDADWERAFGDLGVLRVGDGLSCIYTTAMAAHLEDSHNLTMHGVSIYVAKGGPSEGGGDGGHLWKDCYFGPRPGTSQWKGADGFLCRSTRYGTTLANSTIRHTSDDIHNLHGNWARVQSTAGKQITVARDGAQRTVLKNARPGDRLRFIHRKTGAFLGEAKFVAAKEFTITLDQDAAPFAEGQGEWLDHECAGWLVQDCLFEDNFQTFGIMTGPGILRRCTFNRMGNAVSLNTGMGFVGGIPRDVTIADNTFTDVNPRPHCRSIEARAHNGAGQDGVPPIENLVITGNTITRSGGPAMRLTGLKNARIENNRIFAPIHGTVIAKPNDKAERQAILLRHSSGVALTGNALDAPGGHVTADAASGSSLLKLDATESVTMDGKKLRNVPSKPGNK